MTTKTSETILKILYILVGCFFLGFVIYGLINNLTINPIFYPLALGGALLLLMSMPIFFKRNK